jgi:ApbE superfamily uncharacterized protein (UPF0280 family)
VIVENCSDIFIKTAKPRLLGIYAGEDSALTGRVAIKIEPADTSLGVCNSSGFDVQALRSGNAGAVVALSRSTTLADAAATAIGNLVKEENDIQKALDYARDLKGLLGSAVLMNDKTGVWGKINLIRRDR